MTTIENFTRAASQFCTYEREIRWLKDTAYNANTPVSLQGIARHSLASARKDRAKARRRMIYHYRRMISLD